MQCNHAFHCSSFQFLFLNSCRFPEVTKVSMGSLCSPGKTPRITAVHHQSQKVGTDTGPPPLLSWYWKVQTLQIRGLKLRKRTSPSAKIDSYQLWVLRALPCAGYFGFRTEVPWVWCFLADVLALVLTLSFLVPVSYRWFSRWCWTGKSGIHGCLSRCWTLIWSSKKFILKNCSFVGSCKIVQGSWSTFIHCLLLHVQAHKMMKSCFTLLLL